MKVLVACEFSGTVRDAFRRRGHEAWSCDLLPSDASNDYHIQGDALEAIGLEKWDLLIAHPPCTYLTLAGVRWLHSQPSRWDKLQEAASFFLALWNAPIDRIAIENPIPHGYAGLPSDKQVIQPWQYGHGEVKATCLWLKGLPRLQPTKIVTGREARIHRLGPSADRWKKRSITYSGIAEAMAEQWGSLEEAIICA